MNTIINLLVTFLRGWAIKLSLPLRLGLATLLTSGIILAHDQGVRHGWASKDPQVNQVQMDKYAFGAYTAVGGIFAISVVAKEKKDE